MTGAELIDSFHSLSDAATRKDAATMLLKAVDHGEIIEETNVKELFEKETDITVAAELKRVLNKLQIKKILPNDATAPYDRRLDPDRETRLATEISRLRNIYDNAREQAGAFDRRYRVIEEIDRGGMARVMRGIRRSDNRQVVFKYLLLDQLLKDNSAEQMVARFKREGELCTNRLDHPHLIKGYEYGEINGEYFIVLEYLPDGNLEDFLKHSGPLSVSAFKSVSMDLCDAVEYLHAKDVIHRDIKPANIMLTRPAGSAELSIKLTDFGLARDKKDDRLSSLKFGAGTNDYASPQQLDDARYADERDDIFSIGKTFYQMLTGIIFSNRDGYVSVAEQRNRYVGYSEAGDHEQQVERPTRIMRHETLFNAIDIVILRCIAENRAERWQSISELRTALVKVLSGI